MFGPVGYELLKSHLVRMIQAKSKVDFDEIYDTGKNLLENQLKVNGQLLSIFEEFSCTRNYYAESRIVEIPGNRGRKGSPISESNHSSVLSDLNDGIKGTNRYQEHPILLVQDLLTRQKTHVLIANQRFHNSVQHMKLERAKSQLQSVTYGMNDLKFAASKLNHETCLRYKLRQPRSPEPEYFIQKTVDTTTNEVIMCVQSQIHPDAPTQKFTIDVNSRCNCKDRIAEQDMCVHEIVAKAGFIPQLFEERHFQRKCVSGYLNGWISPPKQKVNKIIG